MSDPIIATCPHCGAENELPMAALTHGSYRCHACDDVAAVPGAPLLPSEQPVPHAEPVQTEPSYVPSKHNTPEAMRRAEAEAAKVGCLLALFAWIR